MSHIADLESVDSLELIWPKIEKITEELGFDYLVYAMANHDNTQFYYYDSIDLEVYREEGFHDPFLEFCCHSYDVTYTGGEFLLDYPYLTKEAVSHIRAAEKNGFKSGVGVPIRLSGSSRYGGFNLGSSMTRDNFLKTFEPKIESIRLLCVLAQRHIEFLMDEENVLSGPVDLALSNIHSTKLQLLTTREKQVLSNISNGNTRKECALELKISAGTVSTHIKNIYRKLGVKNRVEATRLEISAK